MLNAIPFHPGVHNGAPKERATKDNGGKYSRKDRPKQVRFGHPQKIGDADDLCKSAQPNAVIELWGNANDVLRAL